jgi:CO/xanthine dehydrogenase Mo-binding subunit
MAPAPSTTTSSRRRASPTGKPDNIAMTFDYAAGRRGGGRGASRRGVEDTFHLHYVTHCCMGVSGIIAEFDASGNLLLYSNTQVPFLHKREFAEILNMDPARIRIIQPPIGGGFGSKLDIYPSSRSRCSSPRPPAGR